MAADPVIMYAKILAKNIKKPMTSDSRIAKRCSRMSFSVEVKSVPFKPASKSETLGLPRVHWEYRKNFTTLSGLHIMQTFLLIEPLFFHEADS
jgi:hypothetical protein